MENNKNYKGLTFKQSMILSIVSIVLFVALWNFKTVYSLVLTLISYVLPFIIGACIAFIINVPMKAFEDLLAFLQRKAKVKVLHTLNTCISLVLTLLCASVVVALFVNFAVPNITESATDIAKRFKVWYPVAIRFLEEHGIDTSVIKTFDVNKAIGYIKGYFSLDTLGMVNTVIDAASSTVSVVISAFSCVVFSIYMLAGKRRLNHQARKLVYAYLPKRVADKTCYIGSLFYKTFYNFISSQCLDALILALLLYITLRIFGIPYAGIICILTGILALIPYIGAIVACVIGALLLLLVSPFKALIFVVIFITVQQLEGQFIYPHLVGTSIGLPAIWTLVAALVGGAMMNILGVIIFIPLAAVVYALIKEGAAKRLQEKGIVVESPLEIEEREKQRKMQEKKEQRIKKKEIKAIKKEEKKQKKQKK